MRAFLTGLALLALTSTPLAARAQDKGNELDIPFEKLVLDNGLEVILHRDPSAPQIAVNVWYHVGSGDEVDKKTGFAHLFEHMMFQGSRHTGEDVHFPTLQKIGGSDMNGTTNPDRTNYYETVPKHGVETALWLESDRMGYLLDKVTEKSFKNQVDVVRNERRQRYDNAAYGKARFVVAEALYPEGHPYRYLTIGKHEDLENASLDDVRGFFINWYVPSNATLVIAGDFETDAMKALVDKWFGKFPKLPKPARRDVPMPTLAGNTIVDVEDGFAKLVQIQRTWIVPKALSDEGFALDALADVLSADGWGRLSKRLVVQEGLATSVSAWFDGRNLSGEFVVAAQLKPGVSREKALAIIDEEMAKVVAEPVTAPELARVALGAESSFIWALENLGRRADQLQWFNHYAGDPGYVGKYLERVRAVTPDAVLGAAKTWLTKPYVQVTTVPTPGAPK